MFLTGLITVVSFWASGRFWKHEERSVRLLFLLLGIKGFIVIMIQVNSL